MKHGSVFLDPHGTRWRHLKRLAHGIGALLSVVFAVFLLRVIVNPVLPALGLPLAHALPSAHHLAPPQAKRIPNRRERDFTSAKSRLDTFLANLRPTHPPVKSSAVTEPTELLAFLVNWDDTSFTSLKQNIDKIDKLVPEWLHLKDAQGNFVPDDPPKQAVIRRFIAKHRPDLPVMPLINNFTSETEGWDQKMLPAMLKNPQARQQTIDRLFDYIQTNKFSGISIDFENIPAQAQKNLRIFQCDLYKKFHDVGLEVSQSVPHDDPGFDYKGLSACNDYLILMAYDEHWSTGKPGPVASQAFFAAGLQRRLAELPANKYVIAIGNYGYDWQAKKPEASEVSYQDALRTARESEGKIVFDPQSLNPSFRYYDDDDREHEVWFLDAVTAFNQVAETRKYPIKGFALWRLGAEDPSLWTLMQHRKQLDADTANTLSKLKYGYDVDYEGKGEVLKVTATPNEGSRVIGYDAKSGLILSETLSEFPSPYVITRWGGSAEKKIALTFDDGPDERYTPQILDILDRYRVHATFFVVGINADFNPDLLQALVARGHEIGNHTFSHPNIAAISEQQLTLEVNVTERLLESRLGLRSALFRPPYAEDVEPESPEHVKPLLLTSNLGYYTIGMQIDPNDWRNPGTDNIVNAVVDAAHNGEGNVVLLHDSGGDRSQTVEALPRIIETLQRENYRFVPISELLNLPRERVMVPIQPEERWGARIADIGFDLINWTNDAIHVIFITGIALGLARLLVIGLLATIERVQTLAPKKELGALPSASVVLPAYNEAKVIVATLNALLKSSIPPEEILVVDDGSTDATSAVLQEAFANDPRIRLVRIANSGKAAALNHGIALARSEIVITLDADTLFQADTICHLLSHFANPEVGAVAGNAKVGNRRNLITRWQALEYITSQNLDRRAFALLNCIAVVPGAVGAWRRNVLLEAGGFKSDTLAEDADLTLDVLERGYRVNYEPRAVALTEAPEAIRAFIAQRFRWMYGTLQATWKHRHMWFRPRYGALGVFGLPNVLVFQILFPLISPLVDVLMLTALGDTMWQRYQHPIDYSTEGLKQVLFYFALFCLVDLAAAVLAFVLEPREDPKLLVWLLPQRFLYRQLMYYVAIKAALTALKGSVVGWGKLERTASVQK